MSAQHTIGAMNQFADACDSVGITSDQLTALRHPDLLSQVRMVLLGLATIVVACLKLALDKAFNPAEFIGEEWKFWRGPVDGDGLEGDEDYVPDPDVIDFGNIVMETHLQEGETSIRGEEKMCRARVSKNRQLGDKAFLSLWNNWLICKAAGKPEDSILERLRRSGKIDTVVYFFGRVLRYPDGSRFVLYLYFDHREWHWHSHWLDDHWHADYPSAALASVEN